MCIQRIQQSQNNRFLYYLAALGRHLYPKSLLNIDYGMLEKKIHNFNEESLVKRLDYYNKVNTPFSLGDHGVRLRDIPLSAGSMSWADLMEYARFFPQESKLAYFFKDARDVPDVPTIQKSRPIATLEHPNSNAVLFKLRKIRNFIYVNDPIPFRNKANKLVWRGAAYQKHRIEFMQKFYDKSPLIDVAQHNRSGNTNPQWQKPYMSIADQLKNKFIFAIEGFDVATNTCWAFSSNSVVFMAKPKYESWLMEGLLEPGAHYVQLKEDYSDIEDKIAYYIDHPDEAETISHHANQWTEQFKDQYAEDWLGLKILERYFNNSRSLPIS